MQKKVETSDQPRRKSQHFLWLLTKIEDSKVKVRFMNVSKYIYRRTVGYNILQTLWSLRNKVRHNHYCVILFLGSKKKVTFDAFRKGIFLDIMKLLLMKKNAIEMIERKMTA